MSGEWPPSRAEFFLPNNPNRPLFQGDVYEDVPFVKAKFNNNASTNPNITIERRMVAVIGYPCDLYVSGKPAIIQCVAPVVDAAKVNIPSDWSGAYTYVPLADLKGDGTKWAVSLQATANVDARYLVRQNRVASLTRYGWAFFRQRLALCSTRGMFIVEDLTGAGAATWDETELWADWCAAGHPEGAFNAWLNTTDPSLGGFTRRKALEQGMVKTVRGMLPPFASA
jgi:hypothetical protein